jgi:hypothetical protein
MDLKRGNSKDLVWWYGFLSGFPPFGAFLIGVSMGKICIYIFIKYNERKNNATFKGKKETM